MRKYEIPFIIRHAMEEKEIKATADSLKKVLKAGKAKIVSENEAGQKELAYEINKFQSGYYFFLEVEANIETINEFDRVAKINENLLRHLIVRVED